MQYLAQELDAIRLVLADAVTMDDLRDVLPRIEVLITGQLTHCPGEVSG
jgi:hypothetical protein